VKRAASARRYGASRGSAVIELTFCLLLMVIVLLSVVELGRIVLVYTTVSNAARAAARYAIVHGSSRTGSGVDGPSGPGPDPPQVVQVARDFASTGLIVDQTRLTVSVTYTGGNAVGGSVQVGVSYSYDALIGLLPLSGVRLSNESRGVIVF
jgi:hypothetical protein